MMKLTSLYGAALVAATLAAPAFAGVDAATLTCGDFLALEGGGKTDAVRAVALYVNDAANLASTTMASEAIQGKTDGEVQQMIEGDCGGQAPETPVIAVLK